MQVFWDFFLEKHMMPGISSFALYIANKQVMFALYIFLGHSLYITCVSRKEECLFFFISQALYTTHSYALDGRYFILSTVPHS